MILRSIVFAFALLLSSGAIAQDADVPTIEAWCDGGVAGLFQHVTVTPDGEIRASTQWSAERPWPVVGTDVAAAAEWFAELALSGPAEPKPDGDDLVTDAFVCGLTLSGRGQVLQYDLPDLHQAIMAWLPHR